MHGTFFFLLNGNAVSSVAYKQTIIISILQALCLMIVWSMNKLEHSLIVSFAIICILLYMLSYCCLKMRWQDQVS